METVPCNMCGSTENSLLYQIPDLLLENKGELFTLVKCDRCGLVYQNPRPDQEEINQYYPHEYEPFYQQSDRNWLFRKVNRYGIEKRVRLINAIKRGNIDGRLLDVGCSTGVFLNELRQTGQWEVYGNDTSEYATKLARENFQLEVFHGTLFQANYPSGFFDVTTLWDVLEHLPDPSEALEEISRITKSSSVIVVRVPNVDSLDARLFGPSWAGFDQPRHFYVFSKENINHLLQMHGFKLEKIIGGLGAYPTFILSLRFWLANRSISSAAQKKIFGLLNHPISRILSAPVFYLYGKFLLGSEIIVIARKTK